MHHGWLRALTASGRIAISNLILTGQILHCNGKELSCDRRQISPNLICEVSSTGEQGPGQFSIVSPKFGVPEICLDGDCAAIEALHAALDPMPGPFNIVEPLLAGSGSVTQYSDHSRKQ